MESKTRKYIAKTIYLDNEDIVKLDEIIQYTGLNPSQIFRRVLANINKEEIETKDERYKRLSKSGKGKLIKKPTEDEKIHMDDLMGIIDDGKHISSLKAVKETRRGDIQ